VALVANYQELPSLHPVAGLLRDHSFRTLALNHAGRTTLIPTLVAKSGVPEKVSRSLAKLKWKTKFQWSDLIFPNDLQKRLYPDHKEKIRYLTMDLLKKDFPTYYYIHDAFNLWNYLWEYHEKVLTAIYIGNTLREDEYLGQWLAQLNPRIPGFPTRDTIDLRKLIEIVNTFVFLATVQHSAVNYPQETFFSNARSCPTILKSAFPQLRMIQPETLVRSLPPVKEIRLAYAVIKLLSSSAGNNNLRDSFGLYTRTENNTDDVFGVHLETFNTVLSPLLQRLANEIHTREGQKQNWFKYEYLNQGQAARSILI